jgi:hypothetical protein
MTMRILHRESSIYANWAPRNLFPINGNNFAGYQFSSLSEISRDSPYRRTRGVQLPTPRFSQMGLAMPSSTIVTAYYALLSRHRPGHRPWHGGVALLGRRECLPRGGVEQ